MSKHKQPRPRQPLTAPSTGAPVPGYLVKEAAMREALARRMGALERLEAAAREWQRCRDEPLRLGDAGYCAACAALIDALAALDGTP